MLSYDVYSLVCMRQFFLCFLDSYRKSLDRCTAKDCFHVFNVLRGTRGARPPKSAAASVDSMMSRRHAACWESGYEGGGLGFLQGAQSPEETSMQTNNYKAV